MSQIMTRFLSKRKPVLDASSRPPASQSTSTQVQSQAADAEDSLFVTPSTSFSSIVIDDDDDGPTAASVSSTPSSCPPTPSVSSARSRSGRAVFATDFNNIWVLNKKCSGVHLRPPHCRTVTREVSWIWQHGVELSCDQYEKLFVCKICHLSKAYSRGVYIASSTNGAACHLTAAHGLEALASSKRSSPPQGYCNKCGNREDQSIDALIYRQVVVDWVIVHNLSFEMAVARDTLNLLGLSAYLRNPFLPLRRHYQLMCMNPSTCDDHAFQRLSYLLRVRSILRSMAGKGLITTITSASSRTSSTKITNA